MDDHLAGWLGERLQVIGIQTSIRSIITSPPRKGWLQGLQDSEGYTLACPEWWGMAVCGRCS